MICHATVSLLSLIHTDVSVPKLTTTTTSEISQPPAMLPPETNLTVDTDMAKANANKAPDPETRKFLWLKIARREVERCRSTDIEGTMRVLQVTIRP